MEAPLSPREIWRIVWFRKWSFVIPASLVLVATVGVIFAMPPLYRSQATILIERQDVPETVVPSLVTEQIERRLQVLTHRILTANNLSRIADRHELYAEERDELTRAAIAERMQQRIETETVVTEFNDPQTGRRGLATLAFQVRFADSDPTVAQQVTNDLVSAYLRSSLEDRRAIAEQTTDFLANERQWVDRRIATIEDELTEFKTDNREFLPEEAAFKRQLVSNLEQRLRSLDGDLRTLRERESYLSTQLALIDEFESGRGSRGSTPESQLETLRADLARAQARYRENHPDVVRLEREVRSLESVVGSRAGSSALAEEEAMLSAELARLRERYTQEHPDVQRLQRELSSLRETAGEASGVAPATAGVSRNPTYVQLSAQLNSVEAEIATVEDQRAQLEEERVNLQEQLARAPTVERDYNRIMRRLDNALADRDELAGKETTVRLSGSLETTSVGDRLTLVEPPSWPSSPYSPNKKLLLAVGLVLAAGSGGTILTLAQILDRSIRSMRDLTGILGDTPVAAIPVLVTAADQRRKWLRRLGGAALVLVVVGGALLWIDRNVAPVDVVAYQIERWVVTTFPSFAAAPADTPPAQTP